MTCDDRDVQDDLRELGRRLDRQVDAGTPWRERDNLDVIAILDQPSWAILLGLLDECPVAPRVAERGADARLRGRITTEFEFIAENSQIIWVQRFVEDLPRRLLE